MTSTAFLQRKALHKPILASMASLFAIASMASNAKAQETSLLPRAPVPAITGQQAEERVEKGTEEVTDKGPASRSTFGPTAPSFELDSNDDGTKATFSLGFGGIDAHPKQDTSGFYQVTRTNFSVKGSFPIAAENNGETTFNFGKLGNFEKISFGFSLYSSSIGTGQGNGQILNAAVRSCIGKEIGAAVESTDTSPSDALAFERGLEEAFNDPNIRLHIFLEDEFTEEEAGRNPIGGEAFASLRQSINTKCVTGVTNAIGFVGDQLGPDERRRFVESTFDKSAILLAGVNGEVGRQEFKFINTDAFLEVEEERTPWLVTGYAGLLGSDYSWSLRAQYSYVSKYEASDEDRVCSDATGAGMEEMCLEGPIGPPSRSQTSVGSVEFRKLFNQNSELPIGIAPQFTYDFDRNEFAVDLPIYLSRNEAGKLTGGIKIGYRSDMDDVGVGIFVGSPFQVPF